MRLILETLRYMLDNGYYRAGFVDSRYKYFFFKLQQGRLGLGSTLTKKRMHIFVTTSSRRHHMNYFTAIFFLDLGMFKLKWIAPTLRLGILCRCAWVIFGMFNVSNRWINNAFHMKCQDRKVTYAVVCGWLGVVNFSILRSEKNVSGCTNNAFPNLFWRLSFLRRVKWSKTIDRRKKHYRVQ